VKRERARAVLLHRLRARRPDLEQAALARIKAISDPADVGDLDYLDGLRAALASALDYGFAAIEHGEHRAPPPPAPLLAQARLAARNGVGLDTVLRRYVAGYTLLGDCLVEEAAESGLSPASLTALLRSQAALFDRLVAAVCEEHERESASRLRSQRQRRAERVQRLLAGELLDAGDLGYDLAACHLGLVAAGEGAPEVLRDLAASLDRRLLLVQREGETAWAWLGGRRRPDPRGLSRALENLGTTTMALAVGEPAEGLAGWRLTHRQAAVALAVASRRRPRIARYADVALLASVLQDDLLAASLRQLYLAPLSAQRDDGESARATLRAYFAADRNVSSAAAALGVNRHTVAARLRGVEERLGRPLASSILTDLEITLALDEFESRSRVEVDQSDLRSRR